MDLNIDRMARLRRSIELALNQEWPQLVRVERKLANLIPQPIITKQKAAMPAIATVATDGGENRLSLEPLRLQVIRVADSNGEIYFEDFVAQSLTAGEILRFFFQSNERLQRFLRYLEVDWDDIMPRTDFQKSQLLGMLRELMEWAALLKLASQPPAKLLIRDGLLRSVLLNDKIFKKLAEKFELLTKKHNHLLVGISKRSRIINYLSVALGLNKSFGNNLPAYLLIPPALEREVGPANYQWVNSRAMGQLYVARLDSGQNVPLMPVDLARWQMERVDEAMTLLHFSACGSFPIRGYPQALVEADRNARLGGLEIRLLERLMLEEVAQRDPRVAGKARELMLFGKELAEDFSHEKTP